ncbi:MAG: DUF4168 domain-containing protein [Spirochaeta sp.]|jgi:hypothetical protein|nr:DUF4168 domain-containing protein [Spirochaeta sp.]
MVQITKHTYAFRRAGFLAVLALALLIPVATVGAQQAPPPGGDVEVNDAELEQFVDALEEVRTIQQDIATEAETLVDDSTMERTRFEELLQASQGGQQMGDAPTEAEQQEFAKLVQAIQTIQRESNQAMIAAVEDQGMDIQRYNQIAQAVQQDQELMQRIQELL